MAGCAPATVSRALNEPGKVSPDTRARIETAMLELGYVRNPAARALRSQRSHMVGVVIPTLDYALYASLVGAANQRLSAAGLSTLIATSGYDLDTEFAEAKLLLERGAEGLILIGQHHDPRLHRLLERYEVPFVNTYVHDADAEYPSVGFDNESAAAGITRHLVHLGHRNICVISGQTRENDRTTRRLAGIRRELLGHGIDLDDSKVVECAYSITNGRDACATLLSRVVPRPTAIVCGNDILALGATAECTARTLRVPEDISIAGFDNLDLSRHSNPPLTTVDVPADEMGVKAADYLLGRLDGKEVSARNMVEVKLILRDSTAPPTVHY